MFGRNDSLAADIPLLRSVYMKTAETLIEQGKQITSLRRSLGYTDGLPLFERYLEYRQMQSANAPGKPKLAIQFLRELGEE